MTGAKGSVAGSLRLQVSLAQGRVEGVAISSTRPLHLARVLEGRTVAEALALLPLLFSVCGQAQALAGRAAIEAALDLEPDATSLRARRQALAAETIAEHSLTLLRDWAILAGLPPKLEQARQIRATLAALHRPENTEQARADLAAFPECDALQEVVEAVAEALSHRGLSQFGGSGVALLPASAAPILADRLAADEDGSFAARPLWQGFPAETGPFARHAHEPAIAAAGDGLWGRFTARLLDLRAAVALIIPETPERLTIERLAPLPPCPRDSGSGAGWVEAARGFLLHHVEISGGRILRYRILAPTEWNFHPDGPLARGLIGCEGSGGAGEGGLAERVRWLATALDPCVAYEVEVRETAYA